MPGTEVEVQRQPAAGQLTVARDGDERAIGEQAAPGLFVARGLTGLRF